MLSWFKRKPTPSTAGQVLAKENARQRQMRVRATVEQMCRDMGKPSPVWPN